MSSLFDDLKEGLEEAIACEKGEGPTKVREYHIKPLREYSREEIKAIRNKAGMSQRVFAAYMGVSVKTVEAWECGTRKPSGSAARLLEVLQEQETEITKYIVEK